MKYIIFGLIDFFSWPLTLLLMAAAALPVVLGGNYLYQTTNLIICLALLPVYYFAWLILFLMISALENTIIGLFIKKPDALIIGKDVKSTIITAFLHTVSRRSRLIWSLPAIEVFLIPTYTIPFLTHLIFKSYSPGKIRIGAMSAVYSFLTDPDVCHIGKNSIIGGNSLVVSHYLKTLPDGNILYKTAPIIIEDNVTVGGSSTIMAGVNIKKGAIVQAGSLVLPKTIINENEIWGGNPAQFIKMHELKGDIT